MENKSLVERFLNNNKLGKSIDKKEMMSLIDIMKSLSNRHMVDVLYYEHPYDKMPSKIYRITLGYSDALTNIEIIDIDKLKEHKMFKDISIDDLDVIIDLDVTYMSKDDILKMSNETYIGQLEVIKDNLEDVDELYDGYISAEGEGEVEDVLLYLTNDEKIYNKVHYLDDSIIERDNFIFVENVQLKLYLHHSIKFGVEE